MSKPLLRLAIVTPWNTRSAIAGVNLVIARELRERGVAVSVIRSETDPGARNAAALSTEFAVLTAGEAEAVGLRAGLAFDAVCYTMGDNYLFHGKGLDLLADQPGVVMLHDAFLGNLASCWARASVLPDASERLRLAIYGALPPADADLSWLAANQPLTEWPMSMATGGVVNAGHYRVRASMACPGPVAQAPLPVADARLPPPPERQPGDPLTIVTVGHVNSNKLPDEVIRAIGSTSLLRRRCRYRLLGPVEDSMRRHLAQLASNLGVSLKMTGWLEEGRLQAELASSDCIVCLRRPILEGASMSAVVGLLSARPTIVCDAGFYGEIPDELVRKVPEDAAQEAIADAIQFVLDDPVSCRNMGARARAWALDHFTAARYVDELLPVVEQSLDTGFTVSFARNLHSDAERWGLKATDPFFVRIAGSAASLFGRGGSSDRQ